MDDSQNVLPDSVLETDEVSRFADSYASFNRIINSLQRKYIHLQDEFTAQHRDLADANLRLVKLTRHNLSVTEFLDGILNSISAGVIAVDRAGCITHFNKAASRILDLSPNETLGENYRDCIRPGTPLHANALRTAERNRPVDSVERVIDGPDNTSLHLSVSTTVLRDGDGSPTGAVEVFHDLTKIKKMEHELARLNTLAALGEMAATIAHEVRNPLAGIGGFAALLKKDLGDDDPRGKLVDKIIRGVDNLNETVTTLLNYTRFEETNIANVRFDEFMERTIRQYRRDNPDRSGLSIKVKAANDAVEPLPPLEIDPMLFRQVFFNLFSNAADVGGDNEAVEVTFRSLPLRAAAQQYGSRLLLGLDETVAEIMVADTGPGIPEEHLDKIFSPFFTTRSGGNGLGLAVAWKIVKAHGGEITAENRDGGGALFRILLPLKVHAANREPVS